MRSLSVYTRASGLEDQCRRRSWPPVRLPRGLGLGVALAALIAAGGRPALADAYDFCGKIRNDDRIRQYDPELRPGFVRAFHRRFPDAKGGQSDAMLRAQALFRCMDGRLVACFTGANLPCTKLDRNRENAGAEAFCRNNRQAADVPRSASGHASEFVYRCQAGHAETAGTAWQADERGFAKDLWVPMDLE